MDAFLRDAVIDPAARDDNRGVGRRNAGILKNLKNLKTVYYRGTETQMKMNPVLSTLDPSVKIICND